MRAAERIAAPVTSHTTRTTNIAVAGDTGRGLLRPRHVRTSDHTPSPTPNSAAGYSHPICPRYSGSISFVTAAAAPDAVCVPPPLRTAPSIAFGKRRSMPL
jgi:hypothetical protein